ncbi:head GIN domain-containing protein [Hymenobacter edaphi]|uniref:Putative auto-transporter adhesin head GIN domain-containing protein n=1 Tax=Hymenobacter edaphi TaxID=2211146 RepID=A0A328BFV8_9BACT|nr:head GIN domain-containing protein [Hymenobacter edaphi]RAK64714.1 hypothetical protein DLM85_18715 [Hymenobacter edaphi]
MKTSRLPHLACLLVLLAPATAFRPVAPGPPPAAHTAADTREVRAVGPFTRVQLAGSMEVIVTQGSAQKVEVVGQPEDVKEIETTVDKGRLRVGTVNHSGIGWRSFKGPVKVYVTVTTLEGLSVSGSGSLHADSPLTGKAVKVAVSGSGQLRAPLTAEVVEASVSGSGQLRLSGSSRSLSASISGSGRIDAGELKASTGEARISGSGICRLHVAETLDAHISGSGNIYYAGSPRVSSHVSGSGRVSKG